ncbi:GT4 family glycosyltransferase PelF [Streptomyces caniscabiei]|uniref:D-inositol 3-phosphate glycosyltransferase n=2 Tax=Streptomyces caniscabiei TaxID=2746961 RepID=A0A927LAU0_9ACTN|nr:GT4 family glycosyltransferase PelF [Streptomyces caniscabiei]MBD9728902.1 GT4 family glycosyltransferase PelF [Streptomyces caniscabiei]MDX3514531.1 GT4 family glycosyltransferase PelF [Streptomyces caniscabiei]MDX3720031.1 GT4 family glycosyltransferase PelF [Streptomyces caniscabiei]MDX3730991.1 GT4 family glycosyltransferase PelF [Streptomyces caniscabiei]WEO29145.1 GT4 family glycosyltransferase PelF [Streptomyces caniscabiei]
MPVPHDARRLGATRVTLLTEGTYPHSHGGVSVWCDQLVQGMPDVDFDVIAVTGTGREPLVWDLPAHVCRVLSVPMWGDPPEGRPPRGRARHRLTTAYERFLTALLDPGAEDGFAPALYELARAAADGALSPFLRSDRAIAQLAAVWNRPGLAVREARPTLHDALTATSLLEHALRPLAAPAPETGVAHAVSGGVAVLPGLAALERHGVPLLLTEHGVYLRERYLGYRTAPYRWPVKAVVLGFFRLLAEETYRRAALITPGNRYNRLWEEQGGADPESIRTVYNGVDPAAFPPAGPEPETLTLSWAGRVDPIKDLETLIRAFALVRAELPDARLRLFGGTPRGGEAYRERCEALAAELGHGDAVTFEGRVDDIKDAYAAGNVVMLSSISEGFPFTLIEAMSCGRATVSTDVGGVREAVGDTGLVVPPRDPEAMARAALELLGDPPRRRAMGEAARLRVIEQFTLRRTIDTFRAIYLELPTLRQRPATVEIPAPAPAPISTVAG